MRVSIREVEQLPAFLRQISASDDPANDYSDWGVDPSEFRQPSGLRRWVIELDQGDRGPAIIVGDLSAHDRPYGPNPASMAISIGIYVLPDYRAQGIGATAQRTLAQTLHAEGFVRVEASTDCANIAEQRSLAKAGFVFEGVLRSAQVRASGRHDLQLWSAIAPLP